MKKLLLLIIWLSYYKASSQQDSLQSNIITYDDKVATSISLQNFSDSFYYRFTYETKEYETLFTPNTKQRLVANINYKLININLGFTPHFLKTNDLKSKNLNFGIRFKQKQWVQSINFVKQKGFFAKIEDENFYVPKLSTLKIGGTTSYVFNKKYSLGSLFNENEWQKKSAGSFIPNFSFYYTKLRDRDIDSRSEIFTLSLAPSYYYNFIIFKKFLISTGVLFGAGINITDSEVYTIYELTTNIKIGYNSERFFTYIVTNSNNYFEDSQQFQNSYITTKISIGYRFNPPKKAKNLYNDALKHSPIKL